jgi:hypothetical protein
MENPPHSFWTHQPLVVKALFKQLTNFETLMAQYVAKAWAPVLNKGENKSEFMVRINMALANDLKALKHIGNEFNSDSELSEHGDNNEDMEDSDNELSKHDDADDGDKEDDKTGNSLIYKSLLAFRSDPSRSASSAEWEDNLEKMFSCAEPDCTMWGLSDGNVEVDVQYNELLFPDPSQGGKKGLVDQGQHSSQPFSGTEYPYKKIPSARRGDKTTLKLSPRAPTPMKFHGSKHETTEDEYSEESEGDSDEHSGDWDHKIPGLTTASRPERTKKQVKYAESSDSENGCLYKVKDGGL